ncbi:hypothetical protein Taro_001151 [Colocasia esculenta]|uniref:glucan endo-1,3-beta-D-glucosidase n=1 Tax=Colocasia esculenta TaxID=4460 RepID=A0A843TA56_COLES|nr:hypothetical protein [Colocasia esculenta]
MAAPPLLFLLLLLGISPAPSSSSLLGINYGLVANNLPPPEAVVPLVRSIGASRVKIYDADPTVLHAFSGTGVEFVVGLADECVARVCDPNEALTWVKANILPFASRTKISAVTVGNEVLTRNNTALAQKLLPAMQSIRSALAAVGLDKQVVVTTAHSFAILEKSYPPSAGTFRRDLAPYIRDILGFLAQTGAPFLINAYPYFAYKDDPKGISLEYVLFQPNAGVVDPASGLRYDNMLHAQVDAVHTAIKGLMGKDKEVEVRVSETGWPSCGDPDEAGATVENARKYNANLLQLVGQKKGTPLKPDSVLQVYVFALFNENQKPGPTSERNYGLFKPDGSPVYQLGVTVPNGNGGGSGSGGGSSSGGGSGSGTNGGGSGQGGGDSSTYSPGYYSISSATKVGLRPGCGAPAGFSLLLQQAAAWLLGRLFFSR